jgi:hypothetical protein
VSRCESADQLVGGRRAERLPRPVHRSPTAAELASGSENRDMLTIFANGFGAESVARRDEVNIEFSTSSWPRAQAGLER